MSQFERLIKLAEDELTEYSTNARKIEKLRRKIGLSVSASEQKQVREALLTEMQPGGIKQLVAEQRQVVALPFWGIAGLGLLGAASFNEPIGLFVALLNAAGAIALQKWGWELQAKLLLLNTFAEIESLASNPDSNPSG
ncbi:hypothetical protein TUMEXPCC7403_16770 [Tumidithrix helvetica PCC 7403]|uniref:hypothetical protein n=1 Tax=Tumidithrix helvetica TaxID=3457545 RepID=UPI003C8678B1